MYIFPLEMHPARSLSPAGPPRPALSRHKQKHPSPLEGRIYRRRTRPSRLSTSFVQRKMSLRCTPSSIRNLPPRPKLRGVHVVEDRGEQRDWREELPSPRYRRRIHPASRQLRNGLWHVSLLSDRSRGGYSDIRTADVRRCCWSQAPSRGPVLLLLLLLLG